MTVRGTNRPAIRLLVAGLTLVVASGATAASGATVASAAPRDLEPGGPIYAAPGPSVGAPSFTLTFFGQLGAKPIPLTVSWPAGTPDGAPIQRYELERSLDGGPWAAVPLSKPLAQSVALRLPPWALIVFRVRAVDSASNPGEWVESAPRWLTVAQEIDEQVDLSAGWQIVGDRAAYGRRRATTTAGGETATFTFVGRQVGWVARTGPDRGQAQVSIDAGSGVAVDLHRTNASSRRIVYRMAWPTVGPHSITLTTTSAGARVDLDAFVVVTDPEDGALVGAGDISSCGNSNDSDTAAVVQTALADDPSTTVFTAGDNVYPRGDAQYFTGCYNPTWGALNDQTRPTPGNHDYLNNPGAGPYFAYFGDSAGPAGRGWYRYESGTWRVYSLSSECASSTCSDAQYKWLKADLAAEPHRCVMAIWHRPVFSTGPHGSSTRMAGIFKLLYDNGADLVITGHNHMYERFAPADSAGAPDASHGVREFVIGTGGASLYAFKTESSLVEVRDNTTYGVLGLQLMPGAYSWEFLPVPGIGAFTDSGSTACH